MPAPMTICAKPTSTGDKTGNKIRVSAWEEEIYVLAVAVTTIGGTPLVNHEVRILDPETGEALGDPIMTNDVGVVRARVPQNKTYRIEILDEERETPLAPLPADDVHGILLCHFVDEDGNAVADEKVEARSGDQQFDLETDENGRIEAAAHLTAYELTIRGETFTAHALLSKDRDEEESLYRFVLAAASSDDDGVEEAKRRLTEYPDPVGGEDEAFA